jgi:nitroreductase / dihydropteridine reductase
MRVYSPRREVAKEEKMDFPDVVRQRYACKKFDGTPVPQEVIDELVEIARLAPSGLNLQPWKIKIVTEQYVKDELYLVAAEQPSITTCSHLFVLCADAELVPLVEKDEKAMRAVGVPDVIREHVYELAMGLAKAPYEVRLGYAKNMVYIMLANIVNGAKALGLDSCPVTNFQPEEFSRILGIPEGLVPTVIAPVGYAAGPGPAGKRRFPKEDILI